MLHCLLKKIDENSFKSTNTILHVCHGFNPNFCVTVINVVIHTHILK